MLIDDHINLMGANPLVGAERRALRRALSRHDRGLLGAPARLAARGAAASAGIALAARRLRRRDRAELRDAGRDPLAAHDRRRRGRHVDGARGDRRAAHGHRGARHLLHHQHGGGRAAGAARARGSDGDGARACAASSSRCWRRIIGALVRPGRRRSGVQWRRRTSLVDAAARARASTRSRRSRTSRSAPRSRPPTGRRHRLQRRERDLRADDLRRAGRAVQGAVRGPPPLHADRRRRRHRDADAAVRRLPADALGIRRRLEVLLANLTGDGRRHRLAAPAAAPLRCAPTSVARSSTR